MFRYSSHIFGRALACWALVMVGAVPAAAEEVEAAVQRGVAALVEFQDQDGGVRDGVYEVGIERRYDQHDVANTALLSLALSAAGHPPRDDTDMGHAHLAAIVYLLDDTTHDEDGYFGVADGSRMYGHALATLALARVAGQTGDQLIDAAILEHVRQAVAVIVAAQRVEKGASDAGGWRYSPHSRQSDVSVTAWCVEALWAARQAGVEVPGDAINDAAEYVTRLVSDADEGPRYRVGVGSSPSTRAAGAAVISMLPEVSASQCEWLGRTLEPASEIDTRWPTITLLHTRHAAMRLSPDADAQVRRHSTATLLSRQRADGLWTGSTHGERDAFLATALACMILGESPF